MILLKINFKELIKSIIIPLGLGLIVGLITNASSDYKIMNMPSFAPPAILFPIVWTILYILMGISSYIVKSKSNGYTQTEALNIYKIQLILNLLWSFIFFTFKMYLLSLIWIIILVISVIIMIKKFYQISKVSAYLQIPYLLWLLFATLLNFSIYVLN